MHNEPGYQKARLFQSSLPGIFKARKRGRQTLRMKHSGQRVVSRESHKSGSSSDSGDETGLVSSIIRVTQSGRRTKFSGRPLHSDGIDRAVSTAAVESPRTIDQQR